MSSPQKLRKILQAYKPPRSSKGYDMKEKLKIKSAVRKCARQLTSGARHGQTRILVFNFKYGDEDTPLRKLLFDKDYMNNVSEILRRKGFVVSKVCSFSEIPEEWEMDVMSPFTELARWKLAHNDTSHLVACFLVEF